ncbi:MAG TPA: hypothetical protein VFT74_02760 [Isosphaeraceae bacterium]|nr:hypothetical protein [Isosphaeraceae bacterium]
MTGEELAARLQAEGFDYLTTTQALEFINDAYLVDVCEAADWPFLEATTSGTAPLTISDLRSVEYVLDTSQERKLYPLSRRNITDANYNLAETGTPSCYYLTEGKTVNVYPASTTDTISVRYYKTPAALSTSTSPLLPERFHSLIIDAAAARAYENSDDYELRQSKEASFQTRLGRMQEALMDVYRDGPFDFIQITDPTAY